MQLSAVILAGGESKRMGRDKAWVDFGGKPLIELALEKVRELGISEIFISGRPGQDYSKLNCRVLTDMETGCGPIAGIERALHESTSPLVLVLAVDLPCMTTVLLRKLIENCDRCTGAVPTVNDQLEPLVAVYPKRCHTYAFLTIARSRFAVRDFVDTCLQERALRRVRVPLGDASCFANCNTPDDLSDLG